MIETEFLLTIIYILFYTLIGITIIAVAILIVFAIISSNSK